MNEASIKVLIVDDEPLARKRIRILLAKHADFEIVAECANGVEAIDGIEAFKPDLMFLDMQMPEMDGLSVIEARFGKVMPLVIFVTAYNNYGLAAFNSNAVDYLLKPFDEQRFGKAIEKAKERLSLKIKSGLPTELSSDNKQISLPKTYRKHIAIRQDGRVFLVRTEDISWIEAERNYVRIHVGRGESYLRRESIGAIEDEFDPAQFRRVHRSAIVNLDYIKELRSSSGGDYQIVLLGDRELVLSRTYQKNLHEFLS